MSKKFSSRLKMAFVGLLLLVAISNASAEQQQTARPNVIFILTDDLGYSDIGCYGATKVETPHIDRLAAEGLRFTDFHTAASICSPSRAAFLTGAYPQRAGLYMGINPKRTAHWFLGLNPDEITLAEQFKAQDYNTCMVGKWHLGTEPEFNMLKQGFDEYYGMPCNFAHDPRFFDGEKVVHATTPLGRLTELYTERVTRSSLLATLADLRSASPKIGPPRESQPTQPIPADGSLNKTTILLATNWEPLQSTR